MIRFFWPTRLNPSPTGITHLGRGLHWIAVAIAVLMVALGIYTIATSSSQPPANDYFDGRAVAAWIGQAELGLAVAIFLVGRALRYALCRE